MPTLTQGLFVKEAFHSWFAYEAFLSELPRCKFCTSLGHILHENVTSFQQVKPFVAFKPSSSTIGNEKLQTTLTAQTWTDHDQYHHCLYVIVGIFLHIYIYRYIPTTVNVEENLTSKSLAQGGTKTDKKLDWVSWRCSQDHENKRGEWPEQNTHEVKNLEEPDSFSAKKGNLPKCCSNSVWHTSIKTWLAGKSYGKTWVK